MTIGTTFTRELNVTKVCLSAFRLAGLMPAEAGATGSMWDRRTPFAKDLLQSILDELQTEGVFARSVSLISVQLTAGTYIYDLPDTVFDLIEDGAYISPSETDPTKASSELPVMQRDRETWQGLSAKSATSRPTIFWCDRVANPIQVRLWPIPDESGIIRFQAHRLLADVTDGNATVDLERFWQQYLIWELGHQLAISANKLEHGQYLATQAAMKKERAKAQANQGTDSYMWLNHRSNWSR